MAEVGSEISQSKSKLSKVLDAFKSGLKAFEVDSKEVSPDQITPRKVAEVINIMRNPLRPQDQLFELKTVLQNMNYYGNDLDHPEARDAARKALLQLQHQNIVDISSVDTKDGVKPFYRIADEAKLKDLLKGSASGK